jgi:hypothetical protein
MDANGCSVCVESIGVINLWRLSAPAGRRALERGDARLKVFVRMVR